MTYLSKQEIQKIAAEIQEKLGVAAPSLSIRGNAGKALGTGTFSLAPSTVNPMGTAAPKLKAPSVSGTKTPASVKKE